MTDPLYGIPERGTTWQRPLEEEQAQTGDSESAPIYMAVGVALTSWEQVEYAFTKIFAAFMEAQPDAAERVFGALTGVQTKVEVLDQAARAAFHFRHVEDSFRMGWKRLKDHYGAAMPRRNEIAHGMVGAIEGGPPPGNHGFFLGPRYDTKQTHPGWDATKKQGLGVVGKYRYTSEDIAAWSVKFNQLDDLAWFFLKEYLERHPPPEHPVLSPRPPKYPLKP